MKKLLFPLIVMCLFGCEPQFVNPEGAAYGVCGVSNPLEELPWLKAKIEEATQAEQSNYCNLWSVTMASYNGQTVFIPAVSGTLCDTCAGDVVYDCEGELLFACDSEKEAKIRNRKVIWQKP